MRIVPLILVVLMLLSMISCEEPDEPVKDANTSELQEQVKEDASSQQAITQPAKTEPQPVEEPVNPAPTKEEKPEETQEATPAAPANTTTKTTTTKTTTTQTTTTQTTTTPTTTTQTTTRTSSDVPVAPTPAKKEFVAEMSEELARLISLPDQKVKSYEFVNAPPPDNLARDRYLIKGTRVRIDLYQLNSYNADSYFDTVFVDTVTKKATGYCQGIRPGRCTNMTISYDLPYKNWLIKTPYQWLKEIPYGEVQGSETIFDRASSKVYFEKEGIPNWYWLDDYSGLPLRIVQQNGARETKYEFRYLAVNTVTDTDVVYNPR